MSLDNPQYFNDVNAIMFAAMAANPVQKP